MPLQLSTALEFLQRLVKQARHVVLAIEKRFPVQGRGRPAYPSSSLPWPLIEVENEVIRLEQHLNPGLLSFNDETRIDVFRIMEAGELPIHVITAMQAVIISYDRVILHYGWQDVCSKAPPTDSALDNDKGWIWPDVPEIDADRNRSHREQQ